MDFDAILNQLKRPYWSPVHPSQYVITTTLGKDHYRKRGWGLRYPDDIGAFNLMWLVSGVGGPPDDYNPYSRAATAVMSIAHFPVGKFSLSETAARYTLEEFAQRIARDTTPAFRPLLGAIRLRV